MKILLWQVRDKKGYSLAELEELSGVSDSEINAIENQQVSPRLDTLEKLAHALECRICDLFKE